MSSKKASSKETKAAAKKSTEKKVVAKAAAKPAKASEKKPVAKATEKKVAAKTTTASAAKKAPAKPVAEKKSAVKTAKVAESKKPVAKEAPKAAKPAKAPAEKIVKSQKEVAKVPAKKPAAKPAKAEDKLKKTAAKPEAKKAAKATELAEESKSSKAKNTKKVESVVEEEAVASTPVEKKIKDKPVASEPVVVVEQDLKQTSAAGKKTAMEYDYAVLLEGVKKLSKSIMFVEVDEQDDRSNKKKMSSEMKTLDMKPTASIRRKSSLAEETQEELTERILKELEEQNLAFEREAATQMCTRCNRNLVSPEFWVDKHLGYCDECAMILKLGQSKEARKVEYQLGGMGDSLDEEDDEILGPDAEDLKEAEEDLAEMDD